MPIETHPDAFTPGDLSDAIRASLLQLVYTRFGERVAEMASRSLGNAPITARDAAAILRAAAKMSEAREAAFASAGFKATDFTWVGCDRPRVPEARQPALLAYCVKVLGKKTPAAEQLHDRVQAFLEKRGQWPILNTREFQARAKPVTLTLAAWHRGEARANEP
jgi:hypothetical protein